MSKNIIFIQPNFARNINGIATSMISRIKHLLEHTNFQITLISFDFDPHWYRNALKHFKESPKLRIINIYADLMGYSADSESINKTFGSYEISGLRKIAQSENTIFLNEHFKPVLSGRTNETYFNTYTGIEPYTEQTQRPSNYIYSDSGHLLCIKTHSSSFNSSTSPCIQETYFGKSGLPKLIHRFRLGKSKHNPIVLDGITLLDNGLPLAVFSKPYDLIKFWFKNYLAPISSETIIIVDHTFYHPIFDEISNPFIKTIACLHNRHWYPIKPNDTYLTSPLNPFNEWVFKNPNRIKNLVVLSHRQRSEINERFAFGNKAVVIPHVFQPSTHFLDLEKDPNLCIAIGRLTEQKNFVECIHLFNEVLKLNPNAYLEIYGQGEQLELLQNLINELKLSQKVFLKGFSAEIFKHMQCASILLSTSYAEGYPMTMIEAQKYGLPIVAYDADYGVDEIIENNKNGFVIKKCDHHAWVQAVSSLLSDSIMCKRFSEHAKNKSDAISVKEFVESWVQLIQS